MTVEVLSPHPAGNYRALVSEETDDSGDADPAGPHRARQHRSRARAARQEHRQRELAAGYAAATGLLISRPSTPPEPNRAGAPRSGTSTAHRNGLYGRRTCRLPLKVLERRFGSPYNETTQTSSAIIAAIKPRWNMPKCA
jgi:hypothetical protein